MNDNGKNRFVFIDTETGGTLPDKHTLLSIGCVVWQKNEGIISKKEFFLYSEKYIITKRAKEINHFDEDKHNKKAQDGNVVISQLLNYLHQFYDEKELIPLIGHNIQFDISFLKILFKKNNRSFNQYFSHRAIDTYSVYKSLVLADRISENLNSSAEAFKYFGIKVKNRHSAIGDCLATVSLYEKLIDIIK